MKAIEAACIVDGAVVLGDLHLTRQDGTSFNAGRVKGDKGDPGAPGAPGEPGEPGAPGQDLLNVAIELDSTTNLNNVTTMGTYVQGTNSSAVSGLNYPVALAGLLEVARRPGSIGMVWQMYTPYNANSASFYKRGLYNGTWGPWHRYFANEASTPWTRVTATSPWTDYKVIAPAATSGLPRYRVMNNAGELVGGWFGRTTAVTLTAGSVYGSVMSALPDGSRPDELVSGIGSIAYSGAVPVPIQFRVNTDGSFIFIPLGGGTFSNTSNSYLSIPSVRWAI